MKISTIEITNFLRLRRLKLDLTDAPVHLFAGHNEVGKTSLQEAIRFCFLGETDRVSKKSDYKLMITDGAKKGEVRIVVDRLGEGGLEEIARDVATGKGTADDYEYPASLAYLLDATRYAWVDAKTRRSFMFGLLGVTIDRDTVQDKLMQRKIPPSMVEYILPFLRGGFEAGNTEAALKTTEARGGWNALTGERHGAVKGEDWKPEIKDIDPIDLQTAERAVKEAELEYEAAVEALGAAGQYPLGRNFECPACGVSLNLDGPNVREITDKDSGVNPVDDTRPVLEAIVTEKKATLDASREPLEAIQRQIRFKAEGKAIVVKAKEYHKQIMSWKALTDALAPDGIPGEIISGKLQPLNKRLMATAMATDWPLVTVTPTLEIMVDGRPFGLQSDSSGWRAQAAIAEAISHLSTSKLLVLDRIDVLDLPNRGKLINWILGVANEHNTILLLGTLKEPPKLPSTIKVHWLVDGEEAKLEAA